MRKVFFSKKGISPVVASVLMILLVVMLSGMVFLWARGFISEQIEKFGRPIEEQCGEVSFDVMKSDNFLEIVNRGNIDIFHFDIKLSKGGNSEFQRFDFRIDSGEGGREAVTLEMGDGTSPDEIIIYPALLGSVVGKKSNKIFTCLDHGVTL